MHYNSFELKCKSHFGASKQGETICFFVDAPEFARGELQIRFGRGNYDSRPMQRGADGKFFVPITFDNIGVYFYRFRFFDNQGEKIFYRAADGSSTPEPPFDWQQTVYSPDYKTPDYIKGGVIYQIFPDRFYKANTMLPKQYEDRVYVDWNDEPIFANGSVGRVINNDYFGGNLVGIAEKLPYLKSLGVTVIYLNPIFEAHSNHRYNTADYMKIDPTLGTEEDFKKLCEKAGALDIKIILDGVFSHTGSDSVYFNRNNRYDSVGAYNSQTSPYYKWYRFDNWPNKYRSWWGFETLPEVNENDDSFCNFITGENGVIDHWMSLGANGFRLDVADELPDEFIAKIRTAIKRNNENGMLIGEVWEDASNKESYSKLRQYLWGHELDSVMNYPFANEIIRFVRYCGGVDFMNRVTQLIENYPPQTLNCLMNLLSTHDTERLITALAGEPANGRDREWQCRQRLNNEQRALGEQLVKLAVILQYTLPGVPSTYYGDEILSEGYRDPFNRKSFKWEKATDDCKILQFFKMMGKLRKHCPALKDGAFIKAQYDFYSVSFIRVSGDDELLVMVNPSDSDYDFWLPPMWENDELILGENRPHDGKLCVPKKSAAIMGRGDWVKSFLADIDVK